MSQSDQPPSRPRPVPDITRDLDWGGEHGHGRNWRGTGDAQEPRTKDGRAQPAPTARDRSKTDDPTRPPGYLSPGARKEVLRRRRFERPRKRGPAPTYAELHAASSFSFLRGASHPEDLVARAAALDLPAVALLDRGGLYGAPRFYKAAKKAGIKALVGAEIVLDRSFSLARSLGTAGSARGRSTRTHFEALPPDHAKQEPRGRIAPLPHPFDAPTREDTAHLPLLVTSQTGYRNLCKMITVGNLGRPKGEGCVDRGNFERHAEGLLAMVGGGGDPVTRALEENGATAARRELDRLLHQLDGRVVVEIQRHGLRAEEHRNQALIALARATGARLVATGGVRYATEDEKRLQDIMTCVRHHTTLDRAGALLACERNRHLRSAAEMEALFRDIPEALCHTVELIDELDFTLENLGYRFPEFPLPPGETPISYLRQITWEGAKVRFRPLTGRAQAQIEKELAMIEKLDLAGYFLIVWDIVRFCQRHNIMAQGRGSAANSAVCFALRITAVDPVKMELLFERFLSEERGEWPDIDLDLPSGDQREKVIQYVYRRYGPNRSDQGSTAAAEAGERHDFTRGDYDYHQGFGAAMTANVITYRDRMSAREVGKALGYSPDQVDRLAKRFGSWHYDISRGDERSMNDEFTDLGFDATDRRIQLFGEMWQSIQNHPRHLGQHSGGMVIAHGRLDEIVPLEPAAMEGRVIVQWDKDDCADLGLIKVDLLGLGMLNALEEAVPLIRQHENVQIDLAHLPPDDPKTYEMIRRADTVGVFQIESRAQMASLPRNRPETFYDLVIQVAIIRPGPIVGKITHPYFERRLGREEVVYPDPSLKPILEKTLGVPIFQEQILKLAMEAAGFSGGEAEDLRRAMGFKRSAERMVSIERRLREGMQQRGISEDGQKQIIQAITSFALYGFPESHAASFALIAYASSYLKCHHPTAFYLSLLNAWPMGFYHPATLIQEARRAGVPVEPICVNRSGWRCRWIPARSAGQRSPAAAPSRRSRPDERDPQTRDQARPGSARTNPAQRDRRQRGHGIRIGLRYVKGLRLEAGEVIEMEQMRAPFRSIEDCLDRCRAQGVPLREEEATRLAQIGAFASLVDLAERPERPARRSEQRNPGPPRRGNRNGRQASQPRSLSRRDALWQVARAVKPKGPLFADQADTVLSPLEPMSPFEETAADFAGTDLTAGKHPIEYYRDQLTRSGVTPAAQLDGRPEGPVRIAGSIIVRQRPGTAKGLLFLTLEDETGMCQAIIMPDVLKENREVVVGCAGLIVDGLLQKRDGSISIRAESLWPIDQLSRVPSHDFR